MLSRRAALSTIAGLIAAPAARAQSFPTRTVTIVVPYPAGGPADTVARLIAQTVSLPRPILVENRGGGSGVIGTMAVARAEPDGHTLVFGTNQTHATNQSLLKNCPYDAVRDFAPVAHVAAVPHVLAVRQGLEADSVAALVALAKKTPGRLNCGSTGIGSASHLAAELFKIRAGVDIQHVPFRGAAPMTTELLAGRIDLTFATLPSVVSHIDSGALRALAVASPQRTTRLPQIATLAEAGLSGVEADAWFALFAPARTPREICNQFYNAVSQKLSRKETAAVIAGQGMSLTLRPPDEMTKWLPGEIAKWAEVAKAAGVSIQ
jgi:tripartite-type tricarboxylate transporter receptor subunit TctC